MNAKEQYKLAYRLIRLYFVERDEESTNSYPYWFDCPDRQHCGDNCYCLQQLEESNKKYGYAKGEHRRIVPLVSDRIKGIAQQHYLDRRLQVPTCGVLQKVVNSGFFWNFKAYPSRLFDASPRWRWTIHTFIPEWNKPYALSIEEEKATIRQRVTEALQKKRGYETP